ncbi:MAG: BrnT family toxin [Acidobacteriaceae bacterium]
MDFEWDARKAAINFRKHDIAFPFAVQIFEDENRTERRDENEDYGEGRWLTTGLIDEVEIVVVYTIRDQKIRIISARRANSHERQTYWNR